MTESQNELDGYTIGPEWDIHVGDWNITVGPAGLRDFTRDALAAPCWVAIGTMLVYVSGNIVALPHINADEGHALRRVTIPDDHSSNLREVLPEMLGLA